MIVTGGATDVSIDIRAMTSAGAALEGKVAADFVLWYRRDGAKVAIVLSDLALLTTAHADGGIKEIDDGWYRLDLPDAAVAAGVNRVAIGGTVDGGVVLSAPITIRDVANDVWDELQNRVDEGEVASLEDYEAMTRTALGLAAADLDTQLDAILAAAGSGGGDATAAKQDAIKALLDKMAPFSIGTVTGARTGTEVVVYGSVTATYTVDSDGNRTVVFT